MDDSVCDLVISGRVVECERKAERIDTFRCPPQKLIAGVVLLVMMSPAQRNGPFVGSLLAAACLSLAVDRGRNPDVCRIGARRSADAATQRADECQVLLVLDARPALLGRSKRTPYRGG
jgi:hypothetical protein